MAQRIVTKAFRLNQADGSLQAFELGETVEGEVSEHWCVQAHSQPAEDGPADAPTDGDPAPTGDPVA